MAMHTIKRGGAVIAHATTDYHRHRQRLILDDVYVLPEYRGQGYGRRVVEMALARAKRLGVPMYAEAVDYEGYLGQEALEAWYTSLGARKVHLRRNLLIWD